jgi:hypothetical protein
MAQMDPNIREEMRTAASMAVAIAAVDAMAERTRGRESPGKDVPAVVRSVVLIQACLRRKAFYRAFGESANSDEFAELAPPDPLIAVSLYMCRRLRSPKFVNIDSEARAVAGVAVAKADVTMDILAKIVWFYEGTIPEDHPALITLRERLQGLTIYAHEVLQGKLNDCMTPKEVHDEVEHARRTFKVLPELEEQVFSCAEPRMQEVIHDADVVIARELSKCITTLEYVKTAELVQTKFGPVDTPWHEKVDVAHTRRVQFLERELETRWSRPFAGPLPPHSRAARRYKLELGLIPKVVAFLQEEKNHASRLEAQFDVELLELQGLLKNLTLRRKEAKARTLVADLDAKLSHATLSMQHCIEQALVDLGPDNEKVCHKAKVLLSLEAHTSVFAMFAECQAEELRSEMEQNDPAPEAADRRRGIALSIDAALKQLNPNHNFQRELREEFREEFKLALATGATLDEPAGEPSVEVDPRDVEAHTQDADALSEERRRKAAADELRQMDLRGLRRKARAMEDITQDELDFAEEAADSKEAFIYLIRIHDAAAAADLRRQKAAEDLQNMEVEELRKKTESHESIPQAEIDDAENAADSKQAFVSLILAHQDAVAAQLQSMEVADALRKLDIKDLRKKAMEVPGSTEEELRDAEGAADAKEALVDLMSARKAAEELRKMDVASLRKVAKALPDVTEEELDDVEEAADKKGAFIALIQKGWDAAAEERQQMAATEDEAAAADDKPHEPTVAWGSGKIPREALANVPGGVGAHTSQEPRSPGEDTVDEPEEENWFAPVGFEELRSKDDAVQKPEQFAVPGASDGPPLKVATTSIHEPDMQMVRTMTSCADGEAESGKKNRE